MQRHSTDTIPFFRAYDPHATMFEGLNATAVTLFHDQLLPLSSTSEYITRFGDGVWRWIELNHLCNAMLWDEEDQARRTDVPASEIARCKSSIDRYNQRRNDAVELIDECMLLALQDVVRAPAAHQNSETPGAMIDRLSILSLKIHHMALQSERAGAPAGHTEACEQKLRRLIEQRADLCSCLDRLLREASQGHAYFKLYRQFKMYNDPALNPYLYGRQGADTARRGSH